MPPLNFKCSQCPSIQLEEVLESAIVSTTILAIKDGFCDEYDSETVVHDGHIARFQCSVCGYIIRNSDGEIVNEYDDLYEIAFEKGWISE
jgi:ribosomal protein S27E